MIGRIQSRSAFVRVRQEGAHFRSGLLSCTVLLDPAAAQPLVGYALGRSYGSAVRRNRLRRQLRELVKERGDSLAAGYYVFGASPRAHGTAFHQLGTHLDSLIAKFPK